MIFIDDRIGSAELAPRLKALRLPVSVERLAYGDAMFLGQGPDGYVSIAIEQKTLDDLLACIISGRLSGHQLIGLCQTYDYSFLIIEGHWRPNAETGVLETLHRTWVPAGQGARRWMYRDVDNYLTTLEVRGGLHVRRAGDVHETVRIIADLYSWWQEPWEAHQAHLALYIPPPRVAMLQRPPLRRYVASLLPGIGWAKSEAAAHRFASTLELADASESAWREIAGVGKTLATRVYQAIREG